MLKAYCVGVCVCQTVVLKAYCVGVCVCLTSSDIDAEGVLCRCVSVSDLKAYCVGVCVCLTSRRTATVCACV